MDLAQSTNMSWTRNAATNMSATIRFHCGAREFGPLAIAMNQRCVDHVSKKRVLQSIGSPRVPPGSHSCPPKPNSRCSKVFTFRLFSNLRNALTCDGEKMLCSQYRLSNQNFCGGSAESWQ